MATLEFEPHPYLSLPHSSALSYLATSRLLLRYKPPMTTAQMELAAKRLGGMVEAIGKAMVERHLAAARGSSGVEKEVDGADDGLWMVLRERLRH